MLFDEWIAPPPPDMEAAKKNTTKFLAVVGTGRVPAAATVVGEEEATTIGTVAAAGATIAAVAMSQISVDVSSGETGDGGDGQMATISSTAQGPRLETGLGQRLGQAIVTTTASVDSTTDDEVTYITKLGITRQLSSSAVTNARSTMLQKFTEMMSVVEKKQQAIRWSQNKLNTLRSSR